MRCKAKEDLRDSRPVVMIEFRFASLQRLRGTFRFRDGDGWNFLLLVLVGVRLSGSEFNRGWSQGSTWSSIVGEGFAELLGCVAGRG